MRRRIRGRPSRERRLIVTRSWIRRAIFAGLIVALAAPVCVTVAMADDDTVLTGVTESRNTARMGRLMVARFSAAPYVGPPGTPPPAGDEDPPKRIPNSISVGAKEVGVDSGGLDTNLGGGIGLIAASPQTRLENSLKALAKELR